MLERAKQVVAAAMAPVPVSAALTVSEGGWFEGAGVVRVPSVRHSALTSRVEHGERGPLGVCWHWTGGVCRPGYAGVLARKIRTFDPTKDRAASWHLVISKQGWVYQSVPLDLGSWHCAVGTVRDDMNATHRVNRSLVGIELENAGRLRFLDGAWRCHPYWRPGSARPVADPDGFHKQADPRLIVDPNRSGVSPGYGAFDRYPQAQVTAAGWVLRAIAARYGLSPTRCGFLHGDFDERKEDAGPLWRNHLVEVYDRGGLDAAVLTQAGHA